MPTPTAFTVEVPVKCARTGKISRVQMTLAEAADFNKNQALKTETAKDIADFLKGLPGSAAPDMVVMFRGKVVVLDTVVDTKDNTVNRYLHELTQSSEFPKVAGGTRPKKGPNGGKSE